MVLSGASCSMINNLDVTLDTTTKMRPDQINPNLLRVLCEYLPNLTTFTLTAEYDVSAPSERRRNAYAPLLRFMAFLVLRHHNVHRLVLPADSGPDFDDDRRQYDICVRRSVYLQAEKGYTINRGDSSWVWNSTLKWTDATETKQATFDVSSNPFLDAYILMIHMTKFSTRPLFDG